MTKSLELLFNFVMDADRSDWQSRLDIAASCQHKQRGATRRTVSQVSQELPAVRSHTSAIDVMWIPTPDGIKAFGLQVQGSMEGRGVM